MKRIKKLLCILMATLFLFLSCAISSFADNESPLLTFEVISDTHIGVDGTSETLAAALKLIERDADTTEVIVIPGDMTNSGKESQIKEFYDILSENTTVQTVTCCGNHDLGIFIPSNFCRPNQIKYRNEFLGIDSNKIYYSTEINGCKFIVLGSEGVTINTCFISEKQYEFLDSELNEGTKDGKPCFVICHWPLKFTHGAPFLWPSILPGGTLFTSTTLKIKKIMSKYDNTFYISGHLHSGIVAPDENKLFGHDTVGENGGIHIINAPSLGKTNRLGIKTNGTGLEFKVYEDKVVILTRDFLNDTYPDGYTYEVPLV